MDRNVLLSIIVPCYNEGLYIERFIRSLLSQSFDMNLVEIMIIDGLSSDDTRGIISDFPEIKLIDNPNRTVPYALNLGIGASQGKYIVRMDVHCEYNFDYLSTLFRLSLEYGVDNIGSIAKTKPLNKHSIIEDSIAWALSSPVGVGNSLFRIHTNKRVQFVDTVPFGFFRRDVFSRYGLFDEELTRNQDDEFNARIISGGGRVLLTSETAFTYYPRRKFRSLYRMYYQYGYFKPRVNRRIGRITSLRQLAPPLLVSYTIISGLLFLSSESSLLLVPLFFYFCGLILFTIQSAGSLKKVLGRLAACLTIHYAYGIGYLRGLLVK